MRSRKWNILFFLVLLACANFATWYLCAQQTENELFSLARDYNERVVASTTTSLNAQLETIAIDARATLNRIFNGKRKVRSRVKEEKQSLTDSRGIKAITLFKKDPTARNDWRAQFRLISDELEDNPALGQMWVEIDHQTKQGLQTAEQGKIEVLSFETSTSARGLTVYAPYGAIGKEQHEQVLAIMIEPSALKVHPTSDTDIFLVDRDSRYLTSIDASKRALYQTYDKLDHLPIIQLSKHNRQLSGSMVYSPTPGQTDVIGSYQLVGYSGAAVVSHLDTSKIYVQFKSIDTRLVLICFTITMLSTALYLLGSISKPHIQTNLLKRRHG